MLATSQGSIFNLPEPDDVALRISERLTQNIRLAITEGAGSISFARYMQMALYEPGLGYYNTAAEKFGEQGDFVTAPELSALFSQCLARQCAQILEEISATACILEFGSGSGTMAIHILQELQNQNALPATYYIIEPSAELRQRQQQKMSLEIPQLKQLVVWLECLPDEQIEGVILANEVLDAMPVRRIILNQQIMEYAVSCGTEAGKPFVWCKQDIEPQLQDEVHAMLEPLAEELPIPYVADINFFIRPWLNSLNDILHKGVILISDYGYPRYEFFHPQRCMGSLICHYRHHVHDDPFLYPGLQDITASVDFTSVAESASDIGLEVAGFTTQAHFLIACGLEQLIEDRQNKNFLARLKLLQQANRLILPGEMGEKFKFIGLSKSCSIPLQGFSFIDHRARL